MWWNVVQTTACLQWFPQLLGLTVFSALATSRLIPRKNNITLSVSVQLCLNWFYLNFQLIFAGHQPWGQLHQVQNTLSAVEGFAHSGYRDETKNWMCGFLLRMEWKQLSPIYWKTRRSNLFQFFFGTLLGLTVLCIFVFKWWTSKFFAFGIHIGHVGVQFHSMSVEFMGTIYGRGFHMFPLLW